jgi:hypothetical protein
MIMKFWFSNLFKGFKLPEIHYKVDVLDSRRPNLSEILNTTLSLTMELGPNANKRIRKRLKKVYPYLLRLERKGFVKACQEIVVYGCNYMSGHNFDMTTNEAEENVRTEFARKIRLKNNWINDENVDFLFNRARQFISQ